MLREGVRPAAHAVALGAAVLIALLVRGQLLFSQPYAPGADYGHALLFAEQIRSLGDIPEIFPFHQLGLTHFRSSPGLPLELVALDSATDLEPLRLPAFALVFSAAGVLGMYLLGKTIAGPQLGLIAALIHAALPANLEILGWAGYANIYALSLTPFLWWAMASARRRFSHRGVWLAALLASAIALVHLLSAAFVAVATMLAAALDVATAKRRTALLRLYGYLLAASLLLSLPTLIQTARSQLAGDGSLASWTVEVMAVTKPQPDDYLRFFSGAGVALVGVGLAALAARRLKPPLALGCSLSLLLVSAAVAHSWILGVTFYYERALYFATIPVSLCLAYALWSVRQPVARMALIGAVVAAVSLRAVQAAPQVAAYYSVLDEDSISAMTWLRERSSPSDVVFTDGCLGFLWEYFGQRPTAAAFPPIYLSSTKEETIAADARLILQDREAAARLLKSYGVRYVLYDSTCPIFNPNVVLENLSHQPSLKRTAVFGSVYVYQAVELGTP